MPGTTHIALLLRRHLQAAAWLVGSLLLTGSAVSAQPQGDLASGSSAGVFAPAPTSYRVINLSISGPLTGLSNFNSKDQFAISMLDANDFSHAYFYDGRTLRDMGSLGGVHTIVTGINNAGEVAGYSSLPGISGTHAFRWSVREGMRDLGSLRAGGSSYSGFHRPINDRGEVAGYAPTQDGQTHAFRWSPAEGMRDLGGLPGNPAGFSAAHLINNDGMVAGQGTGVGGPTHAFAWTRMQGIVEINTPGPSVANVLSDAGRIAGVATFNDRTSLYTWTRRDGIRNLGTAGYDEVNYGGSADASNGHFTVRLRSDGDNVEHPGLLLDTPGSRLIDLGTLGGPVAFANGINNKAHVVGQSDTTPEVRVPYIWTFREGMVRLAPRLHAPPGLVADYPMRISDNEVILALATNGNLVLLKPDCRGCGPHPHAVGTIDTVDMVEVGATFDASVGFTDDDTAALHIALWTWGDGSGDRQGSVREGGGAGRASASHRYTAPGIYTVSVKVGDRSGLGPTVNRTIVAYEPGVGNASGNGWFASPAGANRISGLQAGRAAFSFVAPAAAIGRAPTAKPALRFQSGTLNFLSDMLRQVPTQDKTVFEGTGKINGAGAYQFRLIMANAAGAGEQSSRRLGLKIWHRDSLTNADVVDYDNQGDGLGVTVPIEQGKIVLQ